MIALSFIRRNLSMPLLAKELIEQAARKRTYIVRALYAVSISIASCLVLWEWMRMQTYDPMYVLGRGREMFELIVWLQLAGIYLFLPPLMCSAITSEKERDALVLLMVTDLRPWQIIMQKYLGRLTPMFTFLLLSLPVMAVTYAFGGVDVAYILRGAWALLWTALQVGALCLMVSAFARTTGAAFVGSYLMGAVFYLAPMVLVGSFYVMRQRAYFNDEWFLVHVPMYVLDAGPFDDVRLANLTIVPLSTLALLVAARVLLVRRAFAPPKNLVLNIFRKLDAFFQSINYLTGGAMLMQSKDTLPDVEPIAWREVNSRALGKPLYLFRILVGLMTPVLLLAAVMMSFHHGYQQQAVAVSMLMFSVWAIAALLLSVQAASTFAGDRSRQTLDLMLTMPISGRELVRQKAAALRRLGGVLLVPFLTLFVLELWWEYGRRWVSQIHDDEWLTYVVCFVLSMVVYLPLVTWLSMWIGMKIKRQSRAIITAVAVLVAWCAGPILMLALFSETRALRFLVDDWWMLLSPAGIIPYNEFARLGDFDEPWLAIIVNFTIYGAIAWWLRRLCLTRADRYLGRVV